MEDIWDTGSKIYCSTQITKRIAFSVITGIILIVFVTKYLKIEERTLLNGSIISIEESHELSDYNIENVEQKSHIGEIVPNSCQETCRTTRRVNNKYGDPVHSRIQKNCTSYGPNVKLSHNRTVNCGRRQERCPRQSNIKVDKFGNCDLDTSTVSCKYNNDLTCNHVGAACPADKIILPKSKKDNTFICKTGKWNTCKLTVEFIFEKDKKIQVMTQQFAEACPYKDGDSLNVFYSPKQDNITSHQTSSKFFLGIVITVLSVAVILSVLDAILLANPSICQIRSAAKLFRTGYDIINPTENRIYVHSERNVI